MRAPYNRRDRSDYRDRGLDSGTSRRHSDDDFAPGRRLASNDFEQRSAEHPRGRHDYDYQGDRYEAGRRPDGGWTFNVQGPGSTPGYFDRSVNRSAESGPHAGRGPRGYKPVETRALDEVCERLTRHGDLDASDIEVTIDGDEIKLEGTVDSRYAKRLAEDIAESVRGIKDVHNHLRLKRTEEK